MKYGIQTFPAYHDVLGTPIPSNLLPRSLAAKSHHRPNWELPRHDTTAVNTECLGASIESLEWNTYLPDI